MTVESPFLLLQYIQMLEARLLLTCKDYRGEFLQRALVVFASMPLFVYIIIPVICFYEGTVFHFVLAQGLLLNGLVIWGVSWALGDMDEIFTGCRLTTVAMPSNETSVMWFLALYFISYELKVRGPIAICGWSSMFFLFLAIMTNVAQLVLHTYDFTEVASGVAIALLTSMCISAIFHLWLIPRFRTARLQRFFRFFGISHEFVRYTTKRHREWIYISDDLRTTSDPQRVSKIQVSPGPSLQLPPPQLVQRKYNIGGMYAQAQTYTLVPQQ